MKRLIFNNKLCIGCQNCELACSMAKTGYFTPSASRIRTFQFVDESLFAAAFCQHCKKPLCVKACEPKALSLDRESGLVCLDPDKCTKCYLCLEACPYGGLSLPAENDYPVKCDLCEGNPSCVMTCPTGALVFEEKDQLGVRRQKTASARLMKKLR